MILTAFPVLLEDEELTPDNVEQFLANKEQVYSRYAGVDLDDKRYTLKRIYWNRGTKLMYG